jgi:streptomycin 6-kinase
VTPDDGRPGVLKLLVPLDGESARREIAVLCLANGEGCAQLLRDDVSRGARLLERLGPSLHHFALAIGQRHDPLFGGRARLASGTRVRPADGR